MFDLEIQKLRNIEAVLKHAQVVQKPYALGIAELDDDAAVWLILNLLPVITDHDDHIREWRMLPGSHPYCMVVTKETLPAFVWFLRNQYIAHGSNAELGLSSCEQPVKGEDRWVVNVWVRKVNTSAPIGARRHRPSTYPH